MQCEYLARSLLAIALANDDVKTVARERLKLTADPKARSRNLVTNISDIASARGLWARKLNLLHAIEIPAIQQQRDALSAAVPTEHESGRKSEEDRRARSHFVVVLLDHFVVGIRVPVLQERHRHWIGFEPHID